MRFSQSKGIGGIHVPRIKLSGVFKEEKGNHYSTHADTSFIIPTQDKEYKRLNVFDKVITREVIENTREILSNLDLKSVFRLMIVLPKGIFRQDYLADYGDSLHLLYELIESSIESEFLDELLSGEVDKIEEKDEIVSKLVKKFKTYDAT